MESSVAGRRRTATRHSAEDQALDQIAKEVWFKYSFFKLFLYHYLVTYLCHKNVQDEHKKVIWKLPKCKY